MWKVAFALTTLLYSASLWGAITLPTNLSDNDQGVILQYLGFGSAFRPVTSPVPLGLYSGVELGLGVEGIPTADIGYLGNGASGERVIVYPRLCVGKGIFESLDLFFAFTPFTKGTQLGIYSGAMRWTFYQATFVPANFALLVSGSSTNVDNLFYAQTEGIDLISGINMDSLSVYIGAGTLYGQGQFEASITNEGAVTNQVGRTFHSLIGATFSIYKLFGAAEIDNYSTTVFSFKLGARL